MLADSMGFRGTAFFSKKCMLNIAGLYDAAWLLVKGIGEKCFGVENQNPTLGLISVSAEKAREEPWQDLTRSGNTAEWQTTAIERMAAGQTFILHGCSLEIIAALCFKHNYCWSLYPHSVSSGQLSFLLEPGSNPVAETAPSLNVS